MPYSMIFGAVAVCAACNHAVLPSGHICPSFGLDIYFLSEELGRGKRRPGPGNRIHPGSPVLVLDGATRLQSDGGWHRRRLQRLLVALYVTTMPNDACCSLLQLSVKAEDVAQTMITTVDHRARNDTTDRLTLSPLELTRPAKRMVWGNHRCSSTHSSTSNAWTATTASPPLRHDTTQAASGILTGSDRTQLAPPNDDDHHETDPAAAAGTTAAAAVRVRRASGFEDA